MRWTATSSRSCGVRCARGRCDRSAERSAALPAGAQLRRRPAGVRRPERRAGRRTPVTRAEMVAARDGVPRRRALRVRSTAARARRPAPYERAGRRRRRRHRAPPGVRARRRPGAAWAWRWTCRNRRCAGRRARIRGWARSAPTRGGGCRSPTARPPVVLDVFAPRAGASSHRVLRPGGRAAVVTPAPDHLGRAGRRARPGRRRPGQGGTAGGQPGRRTSRWPGGARCGRRCGWTATRSPRWSGWARAPGTAIRPRSTSPPPST